MIFCGRTVGCLSLSQSWSRLNKQEQVWQGGCVQDDDDDGDDDGYDGDDDDDDGDVGDDDDGDDDDDDGDVGDDDDDDRDGEHARKILSCESQEMARLEVVFNLQLV